MSGNNENLPMIGGINEADFVGAAEQNERFGRDESVIPFTRILQPLSPQVGSVPGAQAGMFYNFATNTLNDGLIICIPVVHQWNYTEWVSRNDGGGFVKDWAEDEAGWQAQCDYDQRNAYQPVTKDGHAILKARHFFILQLQDGNVEPSIFPFAGTSLKVARQWSSMMQNAPKIKTSKGMIVPAYFYYQYQITVEETKNNKGRWFLPKITPLIKDNKYVSILEHEHGKEIWRQAIEFRDGLKAGTFKAASTVDESQQTEDAF